MHNKSSYFFLFPIYFYDTYQFSGSTYQSPSHSQPRGGRKHSCFSLTFPVTSENLWRPTRPVVPHFPKTWAWFSYCQREGLVNIVFMQSTTVVKNDMHHYSIPNTMHILPFQHKHWMFLLQSCWTSSHELKGLTTCSNAAAQESLHLYFCPLGTENKMWENFVGKCMHHYVMSQKHLKNWEI